MGDNRSREPQHFAEYSLWNDSAYSVFSVPPVNLISFTRPVNDSFFLSPPLEVKRDEVPVQPEAQFRSPGFERYMKRALKVVSREDLFRDPALFKKDAESEDSDPDPEFDRTTFLRPARPRLRTALQVNGRGRRLNLMQRRLEQALAQPAKIERGASMMQRMGWEGGALGRGGGGITTPIPPNATYMSSTAGLGHNTDSAQDSPDSSSESQTTKRTKTIQKTKKQIRQEFKINALLYIREFIKNDLQIELFFEAKLKNNERKTIHQLVAFLMGEEDNRMDTMEMLYLAKDIARRNGYTLGTQSEGHPPHRQICIYKEAKDTMYLITPDDIRNPLPEPEQEEETNPFLKSITKHLKNDPDNPDQPERPTLLEKIIDFFVEFSELTEYDEFRFLGPFNIDEIDVMSGFLGMITRLVEKRPYLDYPEHLVKVFEKGISYSVEEDLNGFVSVKKHITVQEEEQEVEEVEEKKEEIIEIKDE